MFGIFFLIILVIPLALAVRSAWRERASHLLAARASATAVDRAVRIYQRRFVPLLTLAAVLTPLGVASPLLAPLALQLIWPLHWTFIEQTPLTVWLRIARLAWVGSALGLGHSLLAYGVAYAFADDNAGRSLKTFGVALLRDWKRALMLTITLSVPSLLVTLTILMYTLAFLPRTAFSNPTFSILLMVIGTPMLLIIVFSNTLPWPLVSTLIVYESLGPIAALRRSGQIVQAQRSGMFFLVLIDSLIGWLIVSVPASVILTLLRWVVLPTPELLSRFAVLIWVLGSIFVAPLRALGSVEFYLSLHAPTVYLSQRIESWEVENRERDNLVIL